MRKALLLLLLLAGCSKGPQADLQYIGQARSAAAEWALVNEQAGQGRLTGTYLNSMHVWLRQELETSLSSLSQRHSPYGDEIQALIRQPANAQPEELRARAARLKQIEDGLESA